MSEIILSLIAGIICGILFALVKLPIPAPPSISGLLGIVGIVAGYYLIKLIL